MTESNSSQTPPYLPYRTFISSLDRLAEGVPPRIDRGIWKNQTGTNQGLILGAYRFFSLIDEQNKPTKQLQELVTHRNKPNEIVKKLLDEKYADILKHNLSTMTEALINEHFEEAFGVQGDTKRKSITFFLQAAKAVGFQLSTYLQSQVRIRTTGTRRKRREEITESENSENDFEQTQSHSGESMEVALRSGGTLTLNASVKFFAMDAQDRNFVFELIDKLREYEHHASSQKSINGGGK